MPKITEQQRAKVRKEFKKWRSRLALDHWEINFTFIQRDSQGGDIADIEIDRAYLRARVNIYPKYFKQCPADCEDTVVHELSHILNNELRRICDTLHSGKAVYDEEFRIANEGATQAVTNALLRAWRGCGNATERKVKDRL